MKSMTGYGKGAIEKDGRKLSIEIKAVNHRFLDLNIKLPKGLAFAEDIVRKAVSAAVGRGRLDVYVNYEDKRENSAAVTVNYPLLAEYMSVSDRLSRDYGIADDLSFTALLKTEVFTVEHNADDEEIIAGLVAECAETAAQALTKMRLTEGAGLLADMRDKCTNILALTEKITLRSPLVISEYKEKLSNRISEALQDVAIDQARLLNEVAFYTDKAGIDEEIQRLKIHIKHLADTLGGKEAGGRKADFIMQEMNREANTIGSKCNDAEIAAYVIEMKTEIEKLREQVQNIE